MTADDFLAYNPANVKPGWIAFWIVVALCVATFLLWRSMNTQLGKIRMLPRQNGRPGSGPDGEPVVPPADERPGASARGDDDPTA